MEPPNRKPSFDITESHHDHNYAIRPPSPAPTYHSTFGPDKDHASNITNDEKLNKSSVSEKHTPFQPPLSEPFDTTHPHYATPSHPPHPFCHSPPLPVHDTRRSWISHLNIATLLPWILFSIFFLATLWFTSIALGVRIFSTLHPSSTTNPTSPPPFINIIINGQDQINTPTTVAPIPTSTTTRALVPGNGVDPDLGTNTITSNVSKRSQTSSFVTVTRSRG
ncbi:hypothetical protein K505DRAFT_320287 [Melanomma pulvis-pyrius CBS 109.77]|uniref:Uncharacterized protein n=1 Tax=Melanomma pulvis-pyrius CBS 109.77 TaxID=1314802 RepID=A0A6A6XWK9_9PLEO|nr:hypothetical protein K505DRAFT_320287 [Melanomma pulvis-pyrius CBS 109.77]